MSGRVLTHYIWAVIRVLLLFPVKNYKKKFTGKENRKTDELAFGVGATARRGWVPEKGGWHIERPAYRLTANWSDHLTSELDWSDHLDAALHKDHTAGMVMCCAAQCPYCQHGYYVALRHGYLAMRRILITARSPRCE